MQYKTRSGQRYYYIQINDVVIEAWKDGCSIGVRSEGESTQYFDDSKWSMKAAMKFYAEITE